MVRPCLTHPCVATAGLRNVDWQVDQQPVRYFIGGGWPRVWRDRIGTGVRQHVCDNARRRRGLGGATGCLGSVQFRCQEHGHRESIAACEETHAKRHGEEREPWRCRWELFVNARAPMKATWGERLKASLSGDGDGDGDGIALNQVRRGIRATGFATGTAENCSILPNTRWTPWYHLPCSRHTAGHDATLAGLI